MKTLRIRILVSLLITGLVPVTAMTLGLRFMPGGLMPWLLYAALMCASVVLAIGFSGSIARPLKKAIEDLSLRMLTDYEGKAKSWVPNEVTTLHNSLAQELQDEREKREVLSRQVAALTRAAADAESAAIRGLEVLHGIVETSTDGMIFVHNDQHVAMINPAVIQMFRLSEPFQQPGQDASVWLSTVAAQFNDAEAMADTWQAWHDHTGVQEGEWITQDERAIQVRSFEVCDDKGAQQGRVWTFRDMTEARQLAKRLQQSQKMESIGQLAGGIAHDFNNLLTAIRGNLTLAELADSKDSSRAKISDANRAADRAAELVTQILGYSRKERTSRTSTDLSNVVNEVTSILRASLDPKVKLKCNVARDSWQAAADPAQIEQVLLNLCINARDAMPPTGGTIEISTLNINRGVTTVLTSESHHSGEYVILKVRDTGTGIPAGVREHIFEPFYTTKPKGKGTGLGLSMARTVVEQAGGWIEFDSEAGKGTEFRLYLPRAAAQTLPKVVDTPVIPLRQTPLTRGSAAGTVLIVDDEAPVRSIAVNMLRYLGYRVIEAQDGEEALRILQTSTAPIDAMMMDVYMPKLSGRDTFKQMRAMGIDIPVVVCSGFMVERDEFNALSQGRNGPVEVIQKPYSMESLARVIDQAVSKGHHALVA